VKRKVEPQWVNFNSCLNPFVVLFLKIYAIILLLYPQGGGNAGTSIFGSGRWMLTGKQRRFLRALGNALDPIVQIGKGGVTDSVIFSLNEALTARELVKARVLKNCLEEIKDVSQELASATNSDLVQIIGRNIILYRPSEDKPLIELPK
jgi:RNA-binding protein